MFLEQNLAAWAKHWLSEVKTNQHKIEKIIQVNFEIYFLERNSTGDTELDFVLFLFVFLFFRIRYFSKMTEKIAQKKL